MIIFDLDDTLLHTTECITPLVLKNILRIFLQKGLKVESFAKAYQEFLHINETSLSSLDACKTFLQKNHAADLFCIAIEEFQKDFIQNLSIVSHDWVNSFLKKLQISHSLYLASLGREDIQLKKMEKAGIDRAFFSNIVISEGKDKTPHYRQIIQNNPQQGIVCGDRIEKDLVPAKQLGLYTVLIRIGRGKFREKDHPAVDFSIEKLEELLPIIDQVEKEKK